MRDPFPDDVAETTPPARWRVSYIAGDDPRMGEVEDLCYRTLHEPFGVPRQGDWYNMDPDSMHLVAVGPDGVIGYARLIQEGRWGHVRQMVVEPRFRGHGVARAILGEIVSQAGRMGLDGLYLNARMQAIALYEGLGFKVVSEQPFPMPRTLLPHVRMELPLR